MALDSCGMGIRLKKQRARTTISSTVCKEEITIGIAQLQEVLVLEDSVHDWQSVDKLISPPHRPRRLDHQRHRKPINNHNSGILLGE